MTAPSPAPTTWSSPVTTPPPAALPAVRAEGVPAAGTSLGSHNPHCFGCGHSDPAGLRLEVTAEQGVRVSAVLRVTEAHQGTPGMAHGGLLATAFDEAMGFLPWMTGTAAVTARLETDFLLPVPVGSTLFLDCECVGVERRKIYVRGAGRLGGADGPLAVRAAGLFIAVPPRPLAEGGTA